MQIETHIIDRNKIAEVISGEIVIHRVEEELDLLANLYYQDFDKIILHEKNLTPVFFNLEMEW